MEISDHLEHRKSVTFIIVDPCMPLFPHLLLVSLRASLDASVQTEKVNQIAVQMG